MFSEGVAVSETLILKYSQRWRALADETGGPAVLFASTTRCCTFRRSDLTKDSLWAGEQGQPQRLPLWASGDPQKQHIVIQ